MRVTNKMIMNNAASNINSAKETVNTRNKQMTSQKKIDRPSDDPVIAVRSLRLSTTLSQVTQYYQKNIPDAASWLDVSETSLINIRQLMVDSRTLAETGATDTYNEEDRSTMITQLESLQKQMFAEGNADYAKRTVFTGYRTNHNLVFTENEKDTRYRINQTLSIEENMEEHRYYAGTTKTPTTESEVQATGNINDISQTNYYRMRLNYGDIDGIKRIHLGSVETNPYDGDTSEIDYTYFPGGTFTVAGTGETYAVKVYKDESEWAADTDTNIKGTPDGGASPEGLKTLNDKAMVIIRETGDIIMGNEMAAYLKKNDVTIQVMYDKTGFEEGELRPEYYYNCTKHDDPLDVHTPVVYTKFDDEGKQIHFDIEYTVAANQTIVINTEASEVFNSDIQRDLVEMINAVKLTIEAHKKLDEVKKMKDETQYASEEDQELLNKWQEALKKEVDYFEDNLQKLFSTELGKIDEYYATISLGITDLGCKKQSLQLTEKRVGDQRETVQGLQSTNDDLDLSQIIIDYTAAYTAYQASLTAAGKLGESTLLNYL